MTRIGLENYLPQIFPQNPDKKWLYSAAWEGYISDRLYGDMISDPAIQDLYLRALDLTDSDYPRGQRKFKDPDKGLAEHLALAYIHYNEFGLDHPLLKAFWQNDNPKQHAHFVQSLGRLFISSENSEGFFANKSGKQEAFESFLGLAAERAGRAVSVYAIWPSGSIWKKAFSIPPGLRSG